MSSLASAPQLSELSEVSESTTRAVAQEAHSGLTASPRTLSPWLFYDEIGSRLFEEITLLPEYYLTRTERAIFAAYADEIIELAAANLCLTLAELGAGTATKTGLLLQAAVRRQSHVTYRPIDCSGSALEEARVNIESGIPGVTVLPQLANYVTESIQLERPAHSRMLALYIGSSIGNFSPTEARAILTNLRAQLQPGDGLLLGTDLAPGKHKSVETLLAAYDDAAGVTAAFNLNILERLNRELGADFDLTQFAHRAVWNAAESRIEMHLESLDRQRVHIPASDFASGVTINLEAGETIHTENSYKFTAASVNELLSESGFSVAKTFLDSGGLFAVTLAKAF